MNKEQGRILVVDDNEANRDIFLRRLGREGYTVEQSEDGYDALERIQRDKFDLVILDIMMPGLNGLDVLRKIRETQSLAELPVILATAKDQSDDIVQGLELGANDYITKPIDFPVLMARLQIHMHLRRLSGLKDEFLRIASHDLKNSLASILMSAHLLREFVAPGSVMSADSYELITFIVRRSEEMQRIIGDFLDFQAMADGKLVLERTPTDLNEVVANILLDNQGYADSKSIEMITDLAQLPRVSAEASRLGQVLQNFVGNAIKFCPPKARIVIRTFSTADSAVLEVEDSGPGLSEEDLAKTFIKYARLSNKPTGGEKSSGLGLAICRQLIELHGGKVGVRNNPDKGATFWFSLPLKS